MDNMVSDSREKEFESAWETISLLQEELAETNRGLISLTAELEKKDEETKAITQQLWQTAKLATMGELAASIAHELNNPLATISLWIESLLSETDPDSSSCKSLMIIEKEVGRMANLVANLLQFSRPTQKQVSTIDVREEIEKTLELIYYHLAKRSIKVTRQFQPDLPQIHADRQQLRQLFLNLFTNASDAMPGGGALVIRAACSAFGKGEYPEWETEDLNQNGDFVRISVIDTGIGMAREELAKAFDPFFTTKPEGKGTGLGLAICRRVVEGHGGAIRLESEEGKGTEVLISLPLAAKNQNGE